jgi:predicted ATPase
VPRTLKARVVKRGEELQAPAPSLWLVRDRWDDFHFKTSFDLVYFDANDKRHDLGVVKIGQAGQVEHSSTDLKPSFSKLNDSYFSVGQDREYYSSIMALGHDVGQQILKTLNDIALTPKHYSAAENEEVTKTSLLRFVNTQVILQQFRRIAHGGAVLTEYDFSYIYPPSPGNGDPQLNFKVDPGSMPPSNIHVIIGSNGSGKTTLLTNMARSLVAPNSTLDAGHFRAAGVTQGGLFANVVTVSFSAFDPFAGIKATNDLGYSYVGLKWGKKGEKVKSGEALSNDFIDGLEACSQGLRRERWLKAMATLNADPLLEESGVRELLVDDSFREDLPTVLNKFLALSSGHKIVVLSMTNLVQYVEEKTLVLLDEPEAHLHPPLLSAFMRALSDLLEARNGVAVVATHSPVVLQEVPEDCVWSIRRSGPIVVPERLDMETFGESVGDLMTRVFGLEITATGYHQLLTDALVEHRHSYRETLESFEGRLGGEGRALLRSLARRI